MAFYVVTTNENEWEGLNHHKTRPPAEKEFRETIAEGHNMVRLIRWEKDEPTTIGEFRLQPARKRGR